MKRFSPFLLLAASALLAACANTPDSLGHRPPITPAWALGQIVWEDEINTQEAATALVNGYLERDIVNLHYQLIPYIFSTLVEAHLNGGTLLQNVNLEEESHQLGPDLFTKAITSDDPHVRFTLPAEGEWMDWRTGESYPGGTVIDRDYPLDEFPLFVRKGSVIPLQEADGIRLLVTPGGKHGKRTLHLPVGEGTAYRDTTVVI